MSYLVEVRRNIKMPELLAVLGKHPAFRVTRQDNETLDIEWGVGDSATLIVFCKGMLSATSPSDDAYSALSQLAEGLAADVVGEEDLVPAVSAPIARGVFTNRTTWIGWPVFVVVLSVLLVWRW